MLPSCYGILAEAIRTTIRPEFRVRTDLFILYGHNHSTKIYGMVFFHLISLFSTTIRPKIRVPIDLFFLCARDHSTEIYGPLLFILSFVHNHSNKS